MRRTSQRKKAIPDFVEKKDPGHYTLFGKLYMQFEMFWHLKNPLLRGQIGRWHYCVMYFDVRSTLLPYHQQYSKQLFILYAIFWYFDQTELDMATPRMAKSEGSGRLLDGEYVLVQNSLVRLVTLSFAWMT